jgi:dimethylargininase
MPIALVRAPTGALVRCRLTHLPRRPIDPGRAREQHGGFVRVLEEALGREPGPGLARIPPRVVRLPEREDLPDAVFVEDTAVALGETLVLARPGAPERRPEVEDVRAALLLAGGRRRIAAIRKPGTLDGGDVLALGRRVFVGRSSRTNRDGARQLAEILGDEREVTTVPVERCLHLKTAASALPAADGAPAVLVNPRWVDPAVFAPADVVEVPEEEPFAANVLTLPGPDGEPTVLLSARWPRTRRLLEERGLRTVPLDLSELEKAEAGPTCLCLLVEVDIPG